MKNKIILALSGLFICSSLIKADLFYDIYNTTNKNIRVVLFPTNDDKKRQAAINLKPGETKLNYQYYNTQYGTGMGASQNKTWGIDNIMIIDLDTNTFMHRSIKKDLQKSFLKITVSYSDTIGGSKGSEKPMGLWFEYSKKKS